MSKELTILKGAFPISRIRENGDFVEAVEALSRRGKKGGSKGLIGERRFSAKDTGLSPRVMSHWSKVGLLPDGVKNNKGWRKFTLAEIVWLRIAVRLRNFGLSLKRIAEVKKQIMECNLEYGTYPFFDFFVGSAFEYDSYVIILSDGTADIATAIEIELAKRDLPLNKRDVLLISIKPILNELGFDTKRAEWLMPLTPQETALIHQLKKGSKEVRVRLNNGVIKEIERTDIIPDHPDTRKIIDEYIRQNGGYGELTTKYEKGVQQSAEIKRKMRF